MGQEWVSGNNGNKCSVAHFGSLEKAQEALDSLVECFNCTNCSGCWRCSNCSNCTDCSYCSYCSDCSYCSYCAVCLDCSVCSYCSNCSNCSGETKPSITIPTIPDIDKVIYYAIQNRGHLDMCQWHTCETTHCRAGWVVHLAGSAGYELEKKFNTELAAMLIYRESGSPINPARFYDKGPEALADIKRRAGISD